MLNKRKRGGPNEGGHNDDDDHSSSDEENFERDSKQSIRSSHYDRREQSSDESSSSRNSYHDDEESDQDEEEEEINQLLVQQVAGTLMNDFRQFNANLMNHFHMLRENILGNDLTMDFLCFSESVKIAKEEDLNFRIAQRIEHSLDFLKVCALSARHPPVQVSESLSNIIHGGDSLETCKSRLSYTELEMISDFLESDDLDVKLLVVCTKQDFMNQTPICQLAIFVLKIAKIFDGEIVSEKFLNSYINTALPVPALLDDEETLIAWPLFENEQVLLLYGSEESRTEMIQLFSERKVTVIDDIDQVVLSRCIVVVSEDFMIMKKPSQLSTNEKSILEFLTQTDCVFFKHVKYCFEHCMNLKRTMFDECSVLLKQNNYLSGLLEFPLYQHRRRRRHLLDENQIQSFKEAQTLLPDIKEQTSLTRFLPNEIIYHILRFLQVQELLEFRLVNNLANVMCLQNFIWKDVCVNTCKQYPFFSSMNIDAYHLPYIVVYRNYIRPLIKDFSLFKTLCHIEDPSKSSLISKERFLPLLTPTLFIDTSFCPDAEIPIGSSKMAGKADLPTASDGKEIRELVDKISRMGLILQLNLDECGHEIFGLSYHTTSNILKNIFPKSGILYFFCHTNVESPHGFILHYQGPKHKLKRYENGREKNAFHIKFYEALSLPAASDAYFSNDYKKYGAAIRGVDEDDLFDVLTQHIHAPFSQGEPHALFGCLPFVTKDEWIREEDEVDEIYDKFLDMNKILVPILKLSSDCKIEEDQIFRRVFDHVAPVQDFLVSGDAISFSIDKDCKWELWKSFEDGSCIRQLPCFVDDLFEEISEPLHQKYNKKVQSLFFKPGTLQ
nr:unnamed protein product [Naegleria fowleri]